jgi:hypothetical protein
MRFLLPIFGLLYYAIQPTLNSFQSSGCPYDHHEARGIHHGYRTANRGLFLQAAALALARERLDFSNTYVFRGVLPLLVGQE